MYFDCKDSSEHIQDKITELIVQVKSIEESLDQGVAVLRSPKLRESQAWEYMEIVKFITGDEYSTNEGFKIIDSSGTETKKFDKINPNIISVLNDYGIRGWEVVSVRGIESIHEHMKIFGTIETYTLKRKIS